MSESNAARPSWLNDPFRLCLLLVGALALLRLWAVFATPLELYPDEAQYWLWSRKLDFGYWSKPPMIAWLIALTTSIGGNDEAWVRFSSLWLHAGAALALYGAGRRLHGPWTGFWAAAIYSLMPGVQLSSGIASVDAALLFFLSVSILAWVELRAAQTSRRRLWSALGLGAALGLAFLSKYAALYFLIGLGLNAALDRSSRAAWDWRTLSAATGAFLLIAAPNLAWNAAHRFATVAHTAENAAWSGSLIHPGELLSFLGDQLGVFGPLPFIALVAGLVVSLRRGRVDPRDLALLCLIVPPLVIVAIQAFLSRANANWAAAAYPPAAILVAHWLLSWRPKLSLGAVAVSGASLVAFGLAVTIQPAIADAIGQSNGLKRVRGWADTTRHVTARADREAAFAPLTAVAADDRFLYYALAYYGRDWFARPGAPPLRIWVRGSAGNQAEASAPLAPNTGRRALVASIVTDARGLIARDFGLVGPLEEIEVPLDRTRTRDVVLFVGEEFAPKPRP